MAFAVGRKNAFHRDLIIDSARYLFGRDTDLAPWKAALDELASDDLVAVTAGHSAKAAGNSLSTTFGKWIYCMVRVLQPERMIETGVAHGFSSWLILNALHKNRKGYLYSIDLPDSDVCEAYNKVPRTGWLVPDELRQQWKLCLGDARELLPELLRETSPIDIFFHDSDHSYDHMKWEFATMFPALREYGVVLSDDVHGYTAFDELVRHENLHALRFNKGGCALKTTLAKG